VADLSSTKRKIQNAADGAHDNEVSVNKNTIDASQQARAQPGSAAFNTRERHD
jgi:hypothetical protein